MKKRLSKENINVILIYPNEAKAENPENQSAYETEDQCLLFLNFL